MATATVPKEVRETVENFASEVDECPACNTGHEASEGPFFFDVGRPVFLPWNEPSEGLEGPMAIPVVCRNCRDMQLLNPS